MERGERCPSGRQRREGGRPRNDIATLPGLGEWSYQRHYREVQLEKLVKKNKDSQLALGGRNSEFQDILSYVLSKVIIATGSHWEGNGTNCLTHDPIPGVDAGKPNQVTPEQIFAGTKQIGKRVVLMNADPYYMGPSLAEMLAAKGHEVTVIDGVGSEDMAGTSHLGAEHAPPPARVARQRHWRQLGVQVEDGRLQYYNIWGEVSASRIPGPRCIAARRKPHS